MPQKIGLDQPTLKALAGETRVRIIKLLDKKALTQSDIAQELKMKSPTVGEHLKSLERADLVDREKTDRKWKYYTLTQKARMLLHPHTGTIWFIFGVFILSAAATMMTAVNYFAGGVASFARTGTLAAPAMAEAELADAAVETAGIDPTLMMLIMLGVFTMIILVMLISLLKSHGWLGKSLTKK